MMDGDFPLGDPHGATPTTLKSHILRLLRQAILSGRYPPGSRLNESQLAREFSISRIPIREALMQLQESGLVTNHARRGMFVTRLTDEDVQRRLAWVLVFAQGPTVRQGEQHLPVARASLAEECRRAPPTRGRPRRVELCLRDLRQVHRTHRRRLVRHVHSFVGVQPPTATRSQRSPRPSRGPVSRSRSTPNCTGSP